MLAALLKEKKNITLLDYSLRPLQKNELLIKVSSCGVCGTDRHIYEGKAPSAVPVIMGHEYSGIVADRGDTRSEFNIGDRVAVDPNIHCGYCEYCREGRVNYCENLLALGVTLNGGFAEYSIVPVSQAYLLPDGFDLSVAAFAEPLSCCLRGIQNADIKPGNRVVIIGGGSIGLMMLQLAKISGAAEVILIEPEINKQKLGIELGADSVFNPGEVSGIGKTDVIIECVGKNETVELAVNLASKGTRVVIFGLAPSDHQVIFNLQALFRKEIAILNSYLNPFTFAPAVDLLVAGKINVEKLISDRVPLKNINSIFKNSLVNSIKQQIINN